jgi:hypothetical protein
LLLAAPLAAVLTGCGGRGTVCLMPPAGGPSCSWQDLVQASQCGGDDGSVAYRSSTPAEQAGERALFEALLAAPPAEVAALAPRAAAIGLRLIPCGDAVVVVEDDAARRGRGAYVVSLAPAAAPLLVQIPHSFSDRYTLPLGRELFAASRARAVAFSTLHRRGAAGYGDNDNRVPARGHADVAHDADSTFQSFTHAWLAGAPRGLVVQLHGFADRRVDADLVVSPGSRAPAPPWATAVRDGLRRLLPGRSVAVYPDDVDDLGATTNAQGQAVRAAGGRFLHVEMSFSLRESLRRRAGDRARFLAGLAGVLSAQP